jgi:hypothetical protein
MVRNVHERRVAVPPRELAPLLDRLGGPHDVLWPSPQWTPMVLDRPLAVGAAGGHGRVRYRVTGYEPGRRVEFTFDPGLGLDGTLTFSIEPGGGSGSILRNVMEARAGLLMRLVGRLAVRHLHDALLEDLLDRAERVTGTGPARPARWSLWVRVLRALSGDAARPRAVPVPVPPGGLLDGALPRVDFADAQAVAIRPGLPGDPQVWVDAVFRDPPAWVATLMGLRDAVVAPAGIERGDESAFATVARTDDEVLLGSDDRHLDFRASVRREADRVVLSTVVLMHNRLGRAYFALVRPFHPVIVRAMLVRAARRLSRSSNTRRATAPKLAA